MQVVHAGLFGEILLRLFSTRWQVGAATETELEDRKLRIEDAKNATFAAVEEGIVPGGGAVFLHLSELVGGFKDTLTNGEEQLGADIVFKSLSVRQAHTFRLCYMPAMIGRYHVCCMLCHPCYISIPHLVS